MQWSEFLYVCNNNNINHLLHITSYSKITNASQRGLRAQDSCIALHLFHDFGRRAISGRHTLNNDCRFVLTNLGYRLRFFIRRCEGRSILNLNLIIDKKIELKLSHSATRIAFKVSVKETVN